MSNPLLGKKKRDQIVAIDLGSRTSKGVLLQRKGKEESFTLARFTVQDVPVHEKALTTEMLTEHLRKISEALGAKTKQVTISVGAQDSVLRSTEFPLMPVEEMRQMLKFNSKNYLQQELNDYVFDCYIVPPKPVAKMDAPKGTVTKYKVWVGGAKRQYLTDLQAAVKSAGLVADQVALSLLGPVNAFELAQTEMFTKEVIALVDLGFKATTISIMAYGELALNRVVEIGGDKLTSGLSEAMGISYGEAEGIKCGMPGEVEAHLQPLVNALGRELRASVAFFEHQFDRSVSQVLVSGGAARSQFILDNLQSELGVPCKTWIPTSSVELALPSAQMTDIEANTSQLAVAMGAAAMSL